VIVQSAVEWKWDRHGSKFTYRPMADIRYRYSVDGREYEGSRLGYRTIELHTEQHAAADCARYPEGKQLKVYYNPENPADSVLERE
jgi:hypothetical protein